MNYISRLLALLLLLSGCASPATKLDETLLAQIKDGTSTSDEVKSLLGAAPTLTTGSNGKKVWVYHYMTATTHPDAQGAITLDPDRPGTTTVYTSASGQVRLRTLSVLFGPDGRVERHHLYESRTAISATRTAAQLGTPVRPAQLAHIFKGVTERSDLTKHFGEPVGEILDPEGNLVLTWLYAESAGFVGSKPQRQSLDVLVNPKGTVIDYVITQEDGLEGR